MRGRTVGDLVAGRAFLQMQPETKVSEMCVALSTHGVGALGVCHGGQLLGIASERDVVRNWPRIIAAGGDLPVAEIMTQGPVTVATSDSLTMAQDRMIRCGLGYVPVMQDDRPVAMLSFRDIPTDLRQMQERFQEYGSPIMAMAVQ